MWKKFDFHYAFSDSGSFHCLLFVEPLVEEGLDNSWLLGKIRFHVAICLPPLPPLSFPWMPFGNIPPSVISLLCHLISFSLSPWPFLSLSLCLPLSLTYSAWSTLYSIKADFKPNLAMTTDFQVHGETALCLQKYRTHRGGWSPDIICRILICCLSVQAQSWYVQI